MARGILVLGVLLLGCGSRSGLPEPTAEPASETEPNPLCVNVAPSEPFVLARLKSQPAAVVRAGAYVFAASWAFTGSIFRAPIAGGEAVEMVTNQAAVNDMATDGSFIYWVTQGYGGTDGALLRVRVEGGAVQPVVTTLTRPQGVSVFGQYAYFTDGYGPPGPGRVQRVERGGKQATLLAGGLSVPWGIAVDVTGVYYTDAAEGTLERIPLLGGTPAQLETDLGLTYHVAVGGGAVYWASSSPGKGADVLYRRRHASGLVEELDQSLGLIEGIEADERAAFLTVSAEPGEPADGRVKRVDPTGAVTLIAQGAWRPLGLSIDESAVYFATIDADGGGSIRMICRPPAES